MGARDAQQHRRQRHQRAPRCVPALHHPPPAPAPSALPVPQTKRAVEAAFKAPLEELFESFEAAPLASGSIAQVHRARLLVGGCTQEVAVKVRRAVCGGSLWEQPYRVFQRGANDECCCPRPSVACCPRTHARINPSICPCPPPAPPCPALPPPPLLPSGASPGRGPPDLAGLPAAAPAGGAHSARAQPEGALGQGGWARQVAAGGAERACHPLPSPAIPSSRLPSLRQHRGCQHPASPLHFDPRPLQSLNLAESVSQFSHTMAAQADLRIEAAHLRRAFANFSSVTSSVHVPRTVEGASPGGRGGGGLLRGAGRKENVVFCFVLEIRRTGQARAAALSSCCWCLVCFL